MESKKPSVFISHSSDDKVEYVDDLVKEIKSLGVSTFYDTDVICWGDNLKEILDEALKTCTLAVIVISPSYFGKEWTEYEIHSLLKRQKEENHKLILPILYRTSKEELLRHYPALTDIVFKHAKSQSKAKLAQELKTELEKMAG